ncbi:hypothetical protein LPJ71_010813, partial [Coemansia sp. S17]
MTSVISRLAQDPSVKQHAQVAREILKQHQSLLGLGKLPLSAKTSSAPNASGSLSSMSNTVSGAALSAAGPVSALSQL